MKHTRLIKELAKHSIPYESWEHGGGFRFRASGKQYYATWYYRPYDGFNDDCAHSVYVCKNGDKDDLMTDYFCGFFPDTYKRAIEYLTK